MIDTASSLQSGSTPPRRGNTLVLVTAILVLLVIIATAFITRTQDGRKLATVQGHAFQREESASIYAEQLAGEITRSLFPAAVDPIAQAESYDYVDQGGTSAHVNWRNDILTEAAESDGAVTSAELFAERTLSGVPRSSDTLPWRLNVPTGAGFDTYIENQINIERFGADMGDFFGADANGNPDPDGGFPDGVRDYSPDFIPQGNSPAGISNFVPLFDFNFAPFETRAWTNWPDDTEDQLYVPHGPGARDIVNGYRLRSGRFPVIGLPLGNGNPRGNPGFGDTRWLRDSEPRRLGAYYDGTSAVFENGDADNERYTHWTHLSWIPTAQNGCHHGPG